MHTFLNTMRILLDKSQSNIEAAELLHREEMYASSVHCSYYSSIQLMRHLLFNKFGYDDIEFDGRPEVQDKGSHNFLFGFLRTKIDPKESRSYNIYLQQLKDHRKRADYMQIKILEVDSEKALSLATNLNSLLKVLL